MLIQSNKFLGHERSSPCNTIYLFSAGLGLPSKSFVPQTTNATEVLTISNPLPDVDYLELSTFVLIMLLFSAVI